MAHRRIGQVLVDMGFITDEQQELLVDEQHEHPGQLLGKVAIDMGLVNEEQLVQALAEQLSLQTTSISEITIKKDVLAMVTAPMAQMYRIAPVEFDGDTLTVAMCDPQNLSVQDELRTFLGFNIRVVVTSESSMTAALERYYGESTDSVESIVSALEDDAELAKAAAGISADGPINLDDVTALADSAPVRKLLNMVLLMAIREHASDLHFEPFEDEFKIRIKADGVLYEMVPPPRHLAFAITTRIKVMANLDIAERRLPQDGRIELTVGGHSVDLRVSVLPTMFGESVVMRVLDRSVTSLDLNSVGLDPPTLVKFRDAIS
ncbi:MAG TPA: ATPase, T2SS/T4P/T4SS family, partial [Lacipirellulaceae bacterium]|nr:ATPase, T2SS/T4P/T4SS family [Lacipirellulaceae bacterium]